MIEVKIKNISDKPVCVVGFPVIQAQEVLPCPESQADYLKNNPFLEVVGESYVAREENKTPPKVVTVDAVKKKSN